MANRPKGTADTTQAFNPVFPNTVARDPKLSPVGLVLTAYRSTFVGKYKLIPNQLGHLVRKGLGKNVAKAGIANMRAAGYLDRRQPASAPGMFAEAEETLNLPEGRGRFVSRAWFDGTLDLKETAALLFLRAGTGRGKETWRREVEERFQWSERTAARVIDGLMERGLLDKVVKRAATGTHLSTTYSVPKLAAETLARAGVQNQDHGLSTVMQKPDRAKPDRAKPACGKSVHSTYSSRTPYALPTGEHLNILPSAESPDALDQDREMYAPTASRPAAPTISDLHDLACADATLLGWIAHDEGGPETVFEEVPSGETLQAVYAVASDSKLRQALRQATDGRIAYRLLELDGLHTVRWLAAFLVSEAEDDAEERVKPVEALGSILEAIWSRIADKHGEWLNSYALIGKRLAADMYGGWTPRAGLYTSQGKKAALDAIAEADGARTLSPRLRRDVPGFDAFVQKQASLHRINGSSYPTQIESIIANRVRQHMIDGRPVGSIKSWRYFEAHIAEEMDRMRARQWKEGTDDAQAHP
jgi:hypothetical protein